MKADEVRFLFEYDRRATSKVLAALDGLGPASCSPPRDIRREN